MADKSASLIINIVVNDAQAVKAVHQLREEFGGLPPAAAEERIESLNKALGRTTPQMNAVSAATAAAKQEQEAWAAVGVRSTKELEAEIAKLQQITKSGLLDERGIAAAEARIESLNKALGRTTPQMNAVSAATAAAKQEQEAWAATGVRSTKELEAEIAKLQQLTRSGLLDERGIAAASARIESLNKQLGRTTPEAKNSQEALAGMATAAASLAAAVGLSSKISSSVKEYSGLVDNLRAAQAMAGETEESFAMLKAKAIDLASGAAGPKELAAGFLTLASAGQSAQSMVQLTPIVENMAAGSAGALNFASAGNFLTQSLKLFQLSADDAVKVSDTLVKGWSSTATEANELKEAVRAGGSVWAKAYEDRTPIQRLQEYVATAGAAANAGFQGELAGTALKNSLARLINPAAEARAVLDKYKDTIRIFDNTGKVRDFSLIIDDLGRAGLSAQESMALFGEHAGPVLNALVAQGGQAIRDLETKIKNADGAAQQTRDTMQKGLGGAFRELNAQLDVAGIKLVDSVAKPLELVVRGAAEAVKIVSGLPQPLVAATAGTVGMVTAAAGITSAMAGWKLIGPTVLDGVSSFVQIQKAAGAAELSITAIGPAAGVAKAGILSVGAAASAMLPTIAAFGAAWGVGKIVEFGQVAVETYQAVSEASAAASRAQEQQGKYEDKLKRASAAAGVELKSWQEVQAAYQAGTLDYNAMTDTYSKGSGVARAAADVHTKAAQAVGAAAAASRKSIEELDAENKILFDNSKKKYEEYAKGIKDANAQITAIGLRPTDQGGGFADVKGALEDIAASGRVAGSTLVREFDEAGSQVAEYYAGLGGLKLGMSSVAEELFELSQAGKTQEQVWKANQMAAAQYLQSAKELGAQAAEAARRGDDEGAKQLWDAEAAAIAKADALYRKLAVTVKTEWSPAMDEAHRKSTETITKFGSAASKALDLARAGYDKVADAAQRSADAQQYFADKLRDVARESMTEAQAYNDIKRAAAEATAEADRLSKAGDWQGAQEQAKAAAEAWAQVPKEVKDGEQTLVSSAESAKVRADGIRQAAEISKAAYAAERQELEANAAAAQRNAEIIIAAEQAIVAATAAKLAALKEGNASAAAAADEEIAAAKARAEAAQKEVEAAAQKSGDSSGAQATQAQIDKINELVKANEDAAAKIKALEEEKGKVISEESENAKIAAEGVVAAQQQLVDAYDDQRSTLEGLASTEVAIMESVAKATTSASAEIKAAAAAAKTELESIKASIDAIPANKEVTITVREVQARFGGGPINLSAGARVSGPTGYDSVHALLAGNEYIINNKSTADIGFGHFHYENTRQWDKALKSLAAFHGPVETARLLSGFLPQQEITMRPLPSFRPQEPSQSADFMSKMKNFGTINLQIGDVAVPAVMQMDHLAMFHREQEKQRQRMQRSTGRRA